MCHFCKEDYEILAGRAGQKGTVVGTKFVVNEYFCLGNEILVS